MQRLCNARIYAHPSQQQQAERNLCCVSWASPVKLTGCSVVAFGAAWAVEAMSYFLTILKGGKKYFFKKKKGKQKYADAGKIIFFFF